MSRKQTQQATAEMIHQGTTVRYCWATDDGLATVTDKTDDHIAFEGEHCNGWFTHEQIDRLIEDDRLYIVLDAERHDN